MARKRMGYGELYCVFCGEAVERGAAACPRCGRPYAGEDRLGPAPALGAGGVGWSDQADNPCFGRNSRKNALGMIVAMMVISVIIFLVILLTSDMELGEVLPIFGGVMAIEWGFWVVWLIGQYGRRRDWEGVVESKEHYQQEVTTEDDDGYRRSETQLIYKVHFRRNDGKKKTLTSIDHSEWYDYLAEGDHVRYHGKNMNYYEKYDKSRDAMIPCASCGSARDARETYCGRCGAILLKGQPTAYAPVAQVPQPVQAAQAPAGVSPAQAPTAYAPVVQAPQPAAQPARQAAHANFCPNCGARAGGGAFCEECGHRLT